MRLLAVLGIALLSFSGCVSTEQNKHYTDISKNNDFSYFFPMNVETRTFSTIEEADDFVNAAQIKLRSSINKPSAQGLAARLIGEPVAKQQPVVVFHFVVASGRAGNVNLDNSREDLKGKLLDAISVSSVFLVFYGDRAVSISDFYLDDHYRYSSNSQYKGFNFDGHFYKADYPVAWGTSHAFKYLTKEID